MSEPPKHTHEMEEPFTGSEFLALLAAAKAVMESGPIGDPRRPALASAVKKLELMTHHSSNQV